jgi:hypothetical protein
MSKLAPPATSTCTASTWLFPAAILSAVVFVRCIQIHIYIGVREVRQEDRRGEEEEEEEEERKI